MRIHFEFSDEQVKELKALQQKTGASSMEDMFNSAMTMLEWSVNETIKGNEIASVNPHGESYRALIMPILQKAGEQTHAIADAEDAELVLR